MDSGSRILVVDDEASVRLVLRRYFTGVGFVVIEADDGDVAIEKARFEHPALIVLDIEMPRLDGWKTLKALRDQGCRAPVLVLTNVDNVPGRIRGLETGADDYIGKPCDLAELLARVRALLRRTQGETLSSRLRFGELIVDLARKAAFRAGTRVNFTRTEYALLELMARYHGRPVSRGIMLREIWKTNAGSNSHTVDTCLWRLRKKLGDSGAGARWMRNVPGIGYVLECEIEKA